VVYTDTRILSIVPPNIPKPSLVARRHLLRDEGMGRKKCEHGRQRSHCKDCGGGGICEHGRRRSGCKDCGDGGPVIFLEATEVEEFDLRRGGEVPDEWVPTVPALVVGVGREAVVSASVSVESLTHSRTSTRCRRPTRDRVFTNEKPELPSQELL
jgi:hypothetical protein